MPLHIWRVASLYALQHFSAGGGTGRQPPFNYLLWYETPSFHPWNRCSWRYLELSWGWCPLHLCHGDSPANREHTKCEDVKMQPKQDARYLKTPPVLRNHPYLHGVRFAGWGLPVCENRSIVALQDIYKTPHRRAFAFESRFIKSHFISIASCMQIKVTQCAFYTKATQKQLHREPVRAQIYAGL